MKNNLQNEFDGYINRILSVDKQTIKEIHSIFSEEEYIYFPKLILKDILYCYRYGEDDKENYKSGALNPIEKAEINVNENEASSRKEFINSLKNKLIEIIKNYADIAIDYLEKINIFYEQIENREYNIKDNWLLLPLENLKEDAVKYPNRIIIKNKLENEEFFEIKKFDGKAKIISKVFFYLLEGNKKIKPII